MLIDIALCDDLFKIIIVFPTTAEFRGEMKPALQVRIPTPKSNGQPAAKPAIAPPAPAEIDVDDDLNDEIVTSPPSAAVRRSCDSHCGRIAGQARYYRR